MKRKIFAALFVVAATIGLASCSSDDSQPVNNNPSGGEPIFTATIGNETFVAEYVHESWENNKVYIVGQNMDGEELTVEIAADTPGTYPSPEIYYTASAGGPYYVNIQQGANYNGVAAITAIQQYSISGTFSCTAYSYEAGEAPVQITNGSFQNIPLIRAYTGEGTISAKVDGNLTLFNGAYTEFQYNQVLISGYSTINLQDYIVLDLPADAVPGTYALQQSIHGPNIRMGEADTEIVSTSGSVTVTGNSNGLLSGTFTFTGIDGNGVNHQVTEGVFNISL